MPEFYERIRGEHWNRDYITGAEARRLIDEAYEAGRDDARAMPVEDEYGIRFMIGLQPGVGGKWLWLRPVAREQVPEAELKRLEPDARNADGPVNAS